MLALSLSGVSVEAYMSPQVNALYQQACSAEYQNNLPEAIAKLKEAISLSGNDSMLYTKLAGIYSELGDYNNALSTYSKVIQLKPNDAFIYISVGSIYETMGSYSQALEAYQKALQLFPEYKYNYLNIANVQYQTKNYNGAIENYNTFLDIYPQHREARENLAASYLMQDRPERAVSEYEILYKNNPAMFKNYANYGIALVKTKDYKKGSEILEKAIEQDPENTSCHIHLALAYQEQDMDEQALAQYEVIFKQLPNLHSIRLDYGNLLADAGKNNEAIEQFNIYIKNYPNDARAYKNLAIVYKRLNNYDLAIKNYEKALTLKDNDLDVKKDLAKCYHAQQNYITALKYYDEVLKATPSDIDAKTNKALALHSIQRYAEAIPLYEEILATKDNKNIRTNLIDAIVNQGHALSDSGECSEAIKYFQKAISMDSMNDYAYYGLGKTYRKMGSNEKAGEMYEKAIALNPDKQLYSNEYGEFISALYNQQFDASNMSNYSISPVVVKEEEVSVKTPQIDTEKNQQLINSGDKNYKAKDFDKAVIDYQAALKIKPSDEVTLLKIGNSYKMKNDNKNASDFYKKAIFVNPDYADGWFNLGLVYANDKKFSDAKQAFNKVIALNPEYAYAYYALAIGEENENNKLGAVKYYKEFLKYNKDTNLNTQVEDKIKSLEK